MKQASHITLCEGDKLVAWIGIHGGPKVVALDMAVHPLYRKTLVFSLSLQKWCLPGFLRGR